MRPETAAASREVFVYAPVSLLLPPASLACALQFLKCLGAGERTHFGRILSNAAATTTTQEERVAFLRNGRAHQAEWSSLPTMPEANPKG